MLETARSRKTENDGLPGWVEAGRNGEGASTPGRPAGRASTGGSGGGFDTKKAELVAQKILAQHSTRMKVALSELVVQTAEDLRSPEVRPKDRAMAMVALKTVCDRLFGWDREPDAQRRQLARTSNHSQVKSYYQHWLEGTTPPEIPQGAAGNLALINTSPEELAAMAKAKFNRDDHSGPSAADYNGQGVCPSDTAPEQPRAAYGCPTPKKEAPTGPVKEPAPPSRTLTGERMPPPSAPEQPVQGDPSSSPAAQAQAARLKALEQPRA